MGRCSGKITAVPLNRVVERGSRPVVNPVSAIIGAETRAGAVTRYLPHGGSNHNHKLYSIPKPRAENGVK